MDEADAALALCRFSMGDAPGAGEMYMEVLQRTGEKHVQVGLWLCRALLLLVVVVVVRLFWTLALNVVAYSSS